MGEHSFRDYYEILQISPGAALDTIEGVFRLLAKKYHPDNPATGDAEKFQSLTEAHKTLADPEKRAAYDATYEKSKNHQWKAISDAYASDGNASDLHIRRTILSILYTKRRGDPSSSGVGIVDLENIMQWPGETLDFHIWYLKEKKYIKRADTGRFEITVEGVDEIEKDGLIVRKDRLLPLSTDGFDDQEISLIEHDKLI